MLSQNGQISPLKEVTLTRRRTLVLLLILISVRITMKVCIGSDTYILTSWFEREYRGKIQQFKSQRKHLQNVFASSYQQRNKVTLTIMYTFANRGCFISKDCLKASSSFQLYALSVYKSQCNVLNYKIQRNLFRSLVLELP